MARWVVRQRLFLISILILGVMSAVMIIDRNRPAFACTCLGIMPFEENYEQSQIVFSGKVTNLVLTNETYPNVIATFDVHTVWKGNVTKDPLVLTTAKDSAMCGYSFNESQEYLVYAYGKEGELGASSCTRTSPLDLAEADLIALGEGDSTFAADSVEMSTLVPYLIGIGAAMAGVIAFLTLRKRR